MSLLRDFHSQPTHGHAVFALWVYHPPPPVPPFLLMHNQSPKDIVKVTCYSTCI